MVFFKKKKDETPRNMYGMTDVGKRRSGNEDAFELLPDKQLCIVSDGMGGHNAGEVASSITVETLADTFKGIDMASLSEEDIEQTMLNAVRAANTAVYEKGMSSSELAGMGCTLVMTYLTKEFLYACNVGDSRVYVIDKERIETVTTDHSVVMELVQQGEMTLEEARHSQLKNQLTQALGISSVVNPQYVKYPLKQGDTVLLCSDGLWDMLSDAEIHAIVKEGDTLEATCGKLIEEANAAGGHDNITVVVATGSPT